MLAIVRGCGKAPEDAILSEADDISARFTDLTGASSFDNAQNDVFSVAEKIVCALLRGEISAITGEISA